MFSPASTLTLKCNKENITHEIIDDLSKQIIDHILKEGVSDLLHNTVLHQFCIFTNIFKVYEFDKYPTRDQ
jgi:hypothetical protein